MTAINSFNAQSTLTVNNKNYRYYSLTQAEKAGLKGIGKLPVSLKILLENLLRHEDNKTVKREDIHAIAAWAETKKSDKEIAFRPARVLMQDFTGVPAVADLAAMRSLMAKWGHDPNKINPQSAVDLVIDHSIQVDFSGSPSAIQKNSQLEMERNRERYQFLRWGQQAFKNFRVVPPDTGICHQVNLEYLAKTVWMDENTVYPDTLVGTDSHTTMINGLGVLGWGVGGIEAEAVMLGQPISMLIPEVIGVKLTGKLKEGMTATDLVLTLTHLLRKKGVVGKFVEFYGAGLQDLSLPDRATIANMAPEYGATCGFFPIDQITIDYLQLTGRDNIELVKIYAKEQGLWHDHESVEPVFTDHLALDLSSIQPSLAGPKRPQDKVNLNELTQAFKQHFPESQSTSGTLKHGDVVIASITSCTNTSNPTVLMAAGLLAKKAVEKGLKTKSWVKTSFAPGSQVVTTYLENTGLQPYLNQLGFNLVGYGCTTCIGNSGPLSEPIAENITKNNLIVSAVLSGNRNFEGRVHPLVKANWLASPPLVVAFALAGTTQIDLTSQPLGQNEQGQSIYLKDIWPSNAEIAACVSQLNQTMFKEKYSNVFMGSNTWQTIPISASKTYTWESESTYIQEPPFFNAMQKSPDKLNNIINARILALLGDSITTDHISPAGSIKVDSPAGNYLQSLGVSPAEFNSLGARRGNHEVMMRGTFANPRIKNEMIAPKEGGYTKRYPEGEILSIYDAAMHYQKKQIPLVIVAGKEYGTGSSRDWAAKGVKLLGVQAVIAESFERIHRSNLIGMGVLPLEFKDGMTRKTLKLIGDEQIDILGLTSEIKPRMTVHAIIQRSDGSVEKIELIVRIDTQNEIEYYCHGGIMQFVLRELLHS